MTKTKHLIKLAPEPKLSESAAKTPGVDKLKVEIEDQGNSSSRSHSASNSPCRTPNSGEL